MIEYFYLCDLFKDPFIIPFSYDSFPHSNIIGYFEIEVKINLKFMQIVIIFKNF